MNARALGAVRTFVGVTVVAVAGPARGQIIIFGGMPHQPIGQATLATDPGGNLIVSNIGSSGKDGVSIDPGVASGFLLEFDIGPAGALPPGAFAALEQILPPPPPEGQDQKVTCVMINETAGGQAGISIDPQFYNPMAIHVDALRNGVVLQSVVHPPPYPFPMPIAQGPIGTAGGDRLTISNIGSSGKDGFGPGHITYAEIDLGGQPVIQLAGGTAPVAADEIDIFMELPGTVQPAPIDRIDLRAANVPMVIIVDEALGLFGHAHRADGQAQMSAGGDHLTISNIGSSGKDGVSIDIGEVVEAFDLTLGPILRGPDTSFLYCACFEQLAGPEAMLSTSYGYDALDRLFITPDFSPIGAGASSVEVYQGGVLVGSSGGLVGPVVSTEDNPECIIWDITDSCPAGGAKWPGPVPLMVPGLGEVSGDEVRFFPDPPSGLPLVAGYSCAWLSAGGIPLIQINGELGIPFPPCPWDCDGNADGIVSVTDLLALLGQYDPSSPIGCTGGSCDFNGDGCVDVVDLLKLLGHYDPLGQGCPGG